MRRAALFTAAILAAAPLAARDRGVPPATPAGQPVSCLSVSNLRESRVRDDRTIDFYAPGGRVYRNVLPQSCPSLGFEQAFSYRTSISQLCSVDVITVLRRGGSGIPGPTCGLGPFQPVTLAGDKAR